MKMFAVGQVIRIDSHDEVETDNKGKPIPVVGEHGRVVLVNESGTGRICLMRSRVTLNDIFPEDCSPA